MFRVVEEHEFEWPVEIRKPVGVDEKGRPDYETHRIFVTFRSLPLDEAAEAMDPSAEDGSRSRPLMQRVIADWRGVGDESGDPLPCTPDNVARLCRIGYVAAALTEAYFRALTGRAEKN